MIIINKENTKKNIEVIHTNSFSVDEDVIVEKRHRFAGWFILLLFVFIKCLKQKKKSNKIADEKFSLFTYHSGILMWCLHALIIIIISSFCFASLILFSLYKPVDLLFYFSYLYLSKKNNSKECPDFYWIIFLSA